MLFHSEGALSERDSASVSLHSECTGSWSFIASLSLLPQRTAVIIQETMVTLRFTFASTESDLTGKLTETTLSIVNVVRN